MIDDEGHNGDHQHTLTSLFRDQKIHNSETNCRNKLNKPDKHTLMLKLTQHYSLTMQHLTKCTSPQKLNIYLKSHSHHIKQFKHSMAKHGRLPNKCDHQTQSKIGGHD